MSENKNIELNDDMMAKATGGTGDKRSAQFKVGDRVRQKSDKWHALCGFGTIIEVMDYEYANASYRIKWEKYEFPDNPYFLERNIIRA